MKALICDDYTGIDGLRVGDLPEPEPGPGSALVDVEAATVNFADVLTVQGLYQLKPEPPFSPGYELSGTVVVANQCDGLSPGDRIAAFIPFGAFAERVVVGVDQAVKLPPAVSAEVGATLPAGYGTSYHALVDRGRLAAGESLLVLGASGGVGSAAVQIGSALGANVIAAVSSAEKAEAAKANGATHVIRYDQADLRSSVKAITGGGVDVVYDPVGGEATERALRSTNWAGRLLVVGFASGDIPAIPLNLPLLKGNSLVGVFWGRFTEEEPERNAANMDTLIDWALDGTINPVIHKRFGLDDGADALRWVADRKAVGRVLITP